MRITLEVINGNIQDAENKAIELENKTGDIYCFMKYNDLTKIVEEKAKYINTVRSNLKPDADIDKAYKQGWDDCRESMLRHISGKGKE